MQIPELWFADSSKSLGLQCSGPPSPSVQTSVKKQFYGNTELDPVKAKRDFATTVVEVVQRFTANLGVEISILAKYRHVPKKASMRL
jgi:hypothetical protein